MIAIESANMSSMCKRTIAPQNLAKTNRIETNTCD